MGCFASTRLAIVAHARTPRIVYFLGVLASPLRCQCWRIHLTERLDNGETLTVRLGTVLGTNSLISDFLVMVDKAG
eukprot:scaffold78624_cov68-Phaeocystis_antarctica.AAC.2